MEKGLFLGTNPSERDRRRWTMKKLLLAALVLVVLSGCAGVRNLPVREAMQEDHSIPAGKIEGNRFVGIRYPFTVTVPPGWKMSLDFPDPLKDLGYEPNEASEKEWTELYTLNPSTASNVQFDLTPAGRYSTFSQQSIEMLVTKATDSLKGELEKDMGIPSKELEVGPTTPFTLKGVSFAAQKYVTYTYKGVKREQGWIYGFSEPYQVFVLYMILDKPGSNDREAVEAILRSFELTRK
jgi:hypothetical protein